VLEAEVLEIEQKRLGDRAVVGVGKRLDGIDVGGCADVDLVQPRIQVPRTPSGTAKSLPSTPADGLALD
jgi:hypothetical protein